MSDDEDLFLESVIAATLATAPPDQDHLTTARAVITALAERASEPFVVTDPGRGYLTAATPTGCWSASSISCTHLWSYHGGTSAGDPGADKADDVDYLHLCDLDDHVALLLNLRELRRQHLAGEDVPVCEHTAMEHRPGADGVWAPHHCQACGWRPTRGEVTP